MSDLLEKTIVLSLNSAWQPIGCLTVRKAIVNLTGGVDGDHPALALDIATENGEVTCARPVKWEEWINLPVRDEDLFVQTSRFKIRVPIVLVAPNFAKMPMVRPRLSARTVWERDKGTCQYTGRKLTRGEGNLDHITPVSRGGKSTWENLVLADKAINSRKGAQTPVEAGLRLIRQPAAPKALPISLTLREAQHPLWSHFLIN